MASHLTLSEGNSDTEQVFENQLRHVAELNRMGAGIRVKGSIRSSEYRDQAHR